MSCLTSTPAPPNTAHPYVQTVRRRAKQMSLLFGFLAAAAAGAALRSDMLAPFFGQTVPHFHRVASVSALALLLSVPISWSWYHLDAKAAARLATSPNTLARWTYSPAEQAAFAARERERLRWGRKTYLTYLALAAVFALAASLLWVCGAVFRHDGWRLAALLHDVSIALTVWLLLASTAFFMSRLEIARLAGRFAGAVVIGENCLLTGNQFILWSEDNKLSRLEFVPGVPSELCFTMRVAHVSRSGTSHTTDELHLPVPLGCDEEARNITATLASRL